MEMLHITRMLVHFVGFEVRFYGSGKFV